MTHDEGLAMWEHWECEDRPDLFLPRSKDLTQGSSKRLRCNDTYYIALNVPVDYPRRVLKGTRWRVTNLATNDSVVCQLVDRGPSAGERLADVSKAAMRAIGIDPDEDPKKIKVSVQETTDFDIPFGIYGWEKKKDQTD